MKICDCRKEATAFCFCDVPVTGLFEDPREEGTVYMRINPIIVPGGFDDDTYNALNVETGIYARYFDNEEIVPVYGAFHREGNING